MNTNRLIFHLLFMTFLAACNEDESPENECTELPTITIVQVKNAAHNQENGMVEVTAEGGMGNYEFSKNDTLYQQLNKFTRLAPGDYTIYVVDEKGCKGSAEVNVGEDPIIIITSPENNANTNLIFEVKYLLENFTLQPNGNRIYQYLDGEKINEVFETGAISFEVDEGKHIIKLTLASTNQELHFGDSIAIFAIDSIKTLTVKNGSGSGEYKISEQIPIQADQPETGMEFDQWTGDIQTIADIMAAETVITIPEKDITVEAVYKNSVFVLTVNQGAGSGNYFYNEVVNVTANTLSGKKFISWTGDVQYLSQKNQASTTLIMPASSVEITASYEETTDTYLLTVVNGSGSGDYQEGAQVNITADPASAGKSFDVWIGDSNYLADVDESSTTVTMPAQDIQLEATYKDEVIGIVSYAEDIKPILTVNCNTPGCHNSSSNYSDLTTYEGVKEYADLIKEYTQTGYMPTTGTLTEQEKKLIADWVDQGAKKN
ncbi:MAG: InlB B-repeat-containing protein [Candidatus Cyclobacteriaceae bacterium M3_2C_046]